MVKGFDTTSSDPSKLLLDYFFSFFDKNRSTISPDTAAQLVRYWLKSSAITSWVYKQFDNLQIKPKIVLRKNCSKPLFQSCPYEGDQNFPAYQNQQQINICLNRIKNKIQLKQNLDRQLYAAYYKQKMLKKQKQQYGQNQTQDCQYNKDRILMESLYLGCQMGYRNFQWEQDITNRLAKKCAVYLFRRRSQSILPPDSLFRLSSKLADELFV